MRLLIPWTCGGQGYYSSLKPNEVRRTHDNVRVAIVYTRTLPAGKIQDRSAAEQLISPAGEASTVVRVLRMRQARSLRISGWTVLGRPPGRAGLQPFHQLSNDVFV